MMTTTMTVGGKVRINGTLFSVTSIAGTIGLEGTRGGEARLIQNVRSGRWFLLSGSLLEVEHPVESFTVEV